MTPDASTDPGSTGLIQLLGGRYPSAHAHSSAFKQLMRFALQAHPDKQGQQRLTQRWH